MSRKKLVIVSTFYPPKNHIASRRISAFAEYLSEYYDTTVITYTDLPDYTEKSSNLEVIYLNNSVFDSLVTLNSNDMKLARLLKIALRKVLVELNLTFYPVWKIKAKSCLKSILKSNHIDFILSSYSPIDTHEICYEVLSSSERYKNTFWIADMRDELSEHNSLSNRQKTYFKNLEEKLSSRVDMVTSVSQPILKQFISNMPSVNHFLEVRNGYNHEIKPSHSYAEKLRIGYFGSFYSDRKPTKFFEALRRFEHLDDIEVTIASNIHNYDVPYDIQNHIRKIDFLPYEESIKLMGSMDCNLLILPFKSNGEGVYSGKIFDYLSSGRPILGLINTNDVAAQLIKEYKCDYLADPRSIDQILEALIQLHHDWKSNTIKLPDIHQIPKLHRRSQVKGLYDYLSNNR